MGCWQDCLGLYTDEKDAHKYPGVVDDFFLDNLNELEENSEEKQADKLASNWLIEEQALKSFILKTQPKFSKKAIIDFAQSQDRHPGIILGG